jgi:hypothetical protein
MGNLEPAAAWLLFPDASLPLSLGTAEFSELSDFNDVI